MDVTETAALVVPILAASLALAAICAAALIRWVIQRKRKRAIKMHEEASRASLLKFMESYTFLQEPPQPESHISLQELSDLVNSLGVPRSFVISSYDRAAMRMLYGDKWADGLLVSDHIPTGKAYSIST